jgi:hypothetical protein
MLLPYTGDALSELQASTMYGHGVHAAPRMHVGGGGQYIGDMPFDPLIHEVFDINHMSTLGLALEEPHVSLYHPERPLEVNLVADYRNMGGNESVARAKRAVAHTLSDGVYDELSGVADRLNTYVMGAQQSELFDDHTQEAINEHDVADICLSGLTIVVSDFARLKLEAPAKGFESAIAVKVNHLLERRVPRNVGVIALSGRGEVNTNKARKLDIVNQELDRAHGDTVQRLQTQGFEVVPVVVRADRKPFGYDIDATDRQLAQAVDAIAQRQK